MRAIVALGLVTGCAFHPNTVAIDPDGAASDAGSSDAPTDAALPDSPLGTGRRKPITIDHTKVFGALTDFPVWIDLGSDADLRDRAGTTASDVFFTDAAGTPIPWELAAWDPATGQLSAWVRTSLDAVTDTTLYIYFGDPQANHPPAPATVFSNGFKAVWHLDGAGSAIADATGQTPATGNLPAGSLAAGQLGPALDFNGTTHQIDFQNPILGGGSHTISAWVDQRPSNNDDCLIALGTGTADRARFIHTTYQAGHTLGLGFYSDDFNSGVDLRNQGFRLIHWVYDATTSHLYVDGREVQNSPHEPNSSISTIGTDGFIGNIPSTKNFGSNMGINAKLDEVRIANVARSADWIATEHANLATPGFVTVGAEQTPQ
jgi:hypothetical protein